MKISLDSHSVFHEALRAAVRVMLRPILRFCFRRSMKLHELADCLKEGLLEVALEESKELGDEANISRLSMMTGIHRKDVARLLSQNPGSGRKRNPVLKIIGQWRADKKFTTKSGLPRALTMQGRDSEFIQLVRSVSKDLNPYAVLFELERLGAVEQRDRHVTLKAEVFVPVKDPIQGLELLAADTEDLISAVEENIFVRQEIANLHGKTEYDNIPEAAALEIKHWFLNEGSVFHRKARKYLSRFDRDINRSTRIAGKSVRVAIGTFSRVNIEKEQKQK